MPKLFLLDAYAMIYRAYYAFLRTPRINSKGMNTSAIFGFLNTLQDVLAKETPTHIAVVFDPPGPTFRHKIYEQYKAQREETPEDIRRSVPIIKQIVEAYRIPVVQVDNFEADDVIGTLAYKADAAGFDVYMLTPDKDYGQLVGGRRRIYRPRFGGGFEVLDKEQVLQKYNLIDTQQIIDLLGLMGDASDNIPGCPGVGEKTAVKLLNQFGSIDNLLQHTNLLNGALKKKIEENRAQIELSRYLATIKTDVPVAFDEDDFQCREPDNTALAEIFTALEFRTHLKKLQNTDAPAPSLFDVPKAPMRAESSSNFTNAQNTSHVYHLVETEKDIARLVQLLTAQETFCFDTETTSVEPINAELIGISFAIKPHEAYFLPVSADKSEVIATLAPFKAVFENTKIGKIGQNIKYDILVLQNYGINVCGKLFDTMIAHYLINPELRHNMDYMAETLLHYHTIHIEQLIGPKGKNQLNMRQVPTGIVLEYAAEDADITLQLHDILKQQITEKGLEYLLYEIEMPLVNVLARMERNGVLIDDFALAQMSQTMTAQMQQIEHEVRQLAAGIEVNLNSPKQIGELLFDHLHLMNKPKKTKTGQYVTDEETLNSLSDTHPVVSKIINYRGIKKLLSTYIDALPTLINPYTGKIHTSFNQTVTATGRLSSSNPNLQNIPVRDAMGKEIRKAFVAAPGCVFLSADYSQVELRIMAHLSGDINMIAAFRGDHDIHAATAANIFHVPLEAVTPDMRRKAKTANFGIIYGISAFGLAERLGIPRSEAKALIDGYFGTFPQVHTYIEQSIARTRRLGYVETIFHRKRYLPDINSRNANVRGFAERNAINAPIQGTAADIIKIAMIRIDRRMQQTGLKAQMILQVHDELNFNVPTSEVESLRMIVREEMEHAATLAVPLKVDIGIGLNWLEAH